jgi:putative spermidine/putrescine transport system permease protein
MLPFMVIPVWTALQKLDPMVEAAAWSLGASHFTALRRVVLPQVSLGMLSGSLIVFALSASAFAIPGLLGGRRLKMAATVVYDEFMHRAELAARRCDRDHRPRRQSRDHAGL